MCQPLRRSGTRTIWPRVGFTIAAPVGPLIVLFCRPVVYIVCSVCVFVMYGKRCMISARAAAECGPAIDVPDELP